MQQELLTEDEKETIHLLGKVAGKIHKIIGDGDQAEYDWAEAASRLHDLQHMIMSQAAHRAYPVLYRPLGGWRSI